MRSTWFSRAARGFAALALLSATAAPALEAATPGPERPGRRRAANLFAVTNAVINVNRVFCGINNLGELCVDPTNSPVVGGGFWPKGTPDQYIFNSGLQLAGTIPSTAGGGEASFSWAGDTVGVYFFDARGTQVQGDAVTLVYNTLDVGDAAAWPIGAYVRDTSIYHPVLVQQAAAGLIGISQQDLWVRAWDGNPALLSGRSHPMGILVEERALGWNYPVGNEDIIYFVFTFYNITAKNSAVYNNLDPAIRAQIAQVGLDFQNRNEAVFNLDIPDDGYQITNMYAAFAMDPDVGSAGSNYSSAILPFNMGLAYKSDFLEAQWSFPDEIFTAPTFAKAPGFVGVKYLKSPIDAGSGQPIGLTMFSNTRNSATAFPDPVGVVQLFRYLSGGVSPAAGDNPCTFQGQQVEKRLCFLDQDPVDTRFYQSSGPLTLNPGEAQTIVVAYVHAAPVAAGMASAIGGDLKPGIPPSGDSIFFDPGSVRPLEVAAGWISATDTSGDSSIQQAEVTTVPRSLLDKGLVAQTVFDNKFLLPFAPAPPAFHLVPGDNQVTIVWRASATETAGDPFFALASDPTSSLYDPNFQAVDVEGYRIYRGRTSGQLELIAQFDYEGTTLTDYTGGFVYPGACAPELGIQTDCPVTFDAVVDTATSPSEDHALSGNVVQVNPIPPGAARVELANGSILVLKADTAVTGGASGFPPLVDGGVPFVFQDATVRNSFSYFYAVTAFDVNSFKSGPSSLESPRITKQTTPRKLATNLVAAQLTFGVFGDGTTQLNPDVDWDIDAATGRFTGPPPPTAVEQIAATFAPLVDQLLPTLTLEMKIDSVRNRTSEDFPCGDLENVQGICAEFFVTFTRDTVIRSFRTPVLWPIWEAFGGTDLSAATGTLGAFPVGADSVSAARFGIPNGFSNFNAAVAVTLNHYIRYSSHEGQQTRRLRGVGGGVSIGYSPGGSRWFSGADESVDHPTYSIRAGRLTNVDTIFAPLSHVDINPTLAGGQDYPDDTSGNVMRTVLQCPAYAIAMMGRQADIQVAWGGTPGQVASVRDVTHGVDVPFRNVPDGSYGFFGDNNGNGVIDWRDFDLIEGVAQSNAHLGFCAGSDPGAGNRDFLVAQPIIMPVSTATAGPGGGSSGMPTTGTGFGIYINGQVFIMQLTGGTGPSNATWTLRSYGGTVNASTGPGTTTPSGYTYSPVPGSPAIPGLRVVFTVTTPTAFAAPTVGDLDRIHTVPDPYYVTNQLEITPNTKILKFVNLPNQAIVRIYTVSGILVQVLNHNDVSGGGELTWNLRNRNNQFVASGVYFYHVETASGATKVGRFTVVNFAQ